MASEDPESITFTQQLSIRPPTSEEHFILNVSDWVRLRRNIEEIRIPLPWLQIVYSLFMGISISTGLSWVLVINNAELPAYVSPFFQCVAGASFIIGCVCLYLDFTSGKTRMRDVNKILADMEDVENVTPQLKKLRAEENELE